MTTETLPQWERLRPINGRPQSRLQIGWFVVDEPRDFEQFGEYAADYWTATVQPGRYPVYALRDCGQPWHSLLVSMPATIKSGSWWNKRQPGEQCNVHLNLRSYGVARRILDGETGCVELLDGVEPRRIEFELGGEQKHTHGLFFDGQKL